MSRLFIRLRPSSSKGRATSGRMWLMSIADNDVDDFLFTDDGWVVVVVVIVVVAVVVVIVVDGWMGRLWWCRLLLLMCMFRFRRLL